MCRLHLKKKGAKKSNQSFLVLTLLVKWMWWPVWFHWHEQVGRPHLKTDFSEDCWWNFLTFDSLVLAESDTKEAGWHLRGGVTGEEDWHVPVSFPAERTSLWPGQWTPLMMHELTCTHAPVQHSNQTYIIGRMIVIGYLMSLQLPRPPREHWVDSALSDIKSVGFWASF